jgi:hypothetical protein
MRLAEHHERVNSVWQCKVNGCICNALEKMPVLGLVQGLAFFMLGVTLAKREFTTLRSSGIKIVSFHHAKGVTGYFCLRSLANIRCSMSPLLPGLLADRRNRTTRGHNY